MRGYGLLLAVAMGGCGLEEWRNADLHLDIRGASLVDEDRVRLCVEGVGHRDQALGAGRVAFTGLPAGEPAMVTVEHLSEDGGSLGRAGPVELDGSGVVETEWAPCEEVCTPCEVDGERAEDGAADWLLGVRFVESP
jgi:hypothetical protein